MKKLIHTKVNMMSGKKILFLSISEASGHKSAMNALIKSIKQMYPNSETIGLNFFNFLPKKLVKLIDTAYYSMIDKKPGTWTFLRNTKLIRTLNKPFEMLFCFFISLPFYFKILRKNKFKTIVCTQSFPCVCMCLLKKLKFINSKIIAIITDYSINPYWVNKTVDEFILPHKTLETELIKNKINASKIFPLGIPIDPKFSQKINTQIITEQYGINKEKTIALIMGGSLGLGNIDEAVELLINDKNLFLIVVTGNNNKLELNLKQKYKNEKNMLVFGYIDNVFELMNVSDILICKPGGVTIAEALSLGIKLIVINPIPGQEEANKNFLVENKLAYYCHNITHLPIIIREITLNYNVKIKKPSLHGFPDSAENIARLV